MLTKASSVFNENKYIKKLELLIELYVICFWIAFDMCLYTTI